MDVSMALAAWPDGPLLGRGAMLVGPISNRVPHHLGEPGDALRLRLRPRRVPRAVQDPSCTLVHYFQPVEQLELHGGSERAFQFIELTVDGRRRPVRRTTRTGAQVFTVSLGDETALAGRALTISYTYRVLIQQQGHLLHLDISRPTKGLRVELAYGGCDIRRVNVVDYIASSPAARTDAPAPVGTDAKRRAALRRVDPAQSRGRVRVGVGAGDGADALIGR